MSRSFKRQPFMAICGNGSAKRDKTLAHQGVRRAHRLTLHNALKSEDFDVLLPHRLECSWNNTYSWGRDGKQKYRGLRAKDWGRYVQATEFITMWPAMQRYVTKHFSEWPPQWYVQMMRK